MMTGAIERLRWKKFPVLSDGFVCLVDVMGDDLSIVQAARVSYGKDQRDAESDQDNLKQLQDARQLIRYLLRHRHTTPLEMCELKFLVRVPMDCWRQWIRHRTASVNETSTRYTEAIDSMDTTPPDKWRLQATGNRQGSDGYLPLFMVEGEPGTQDYDQAHLAWEGPRDENGFPLDGAVLSYSEERLQRFAREVYEERLRAGIAREQARKDLPLSTYTEAYWKIDLHNLLHFLGLRMDSHAQKEIRDYATIIGKEIVAALFPLTWEAFEDYRLDAMHLTSLDIAVMQEMTGRYVLPEGIPGAGSEVWPIEWRGKKQCRERDECIAKLQRLGVLLENEEVQND